MKRQSVIDLDLEIAELIPAKERAEARRALTVPVMSVGQGAWDHPTEAPPDVRLGLLIVDARMVRELVIESARSVELLGERDLLRPWQEDASSFSWSRWRVLRAGRLAVLDDRFVRQLARWPQLAVTLVERATRRSRGTVLEAAISNMVGIDRRLLTFLWHIAEKWGRVDAGAVVVEAKLTHGLLAELVGARRPSVTQALGRLAERGEIELRSDGCWALKGSPPSTSPPAPSAIARTLGPSSFG